MTSEICVMNRMSVVLAADSASTVSYYENGELQQRYFKGANKVFQLSETHPVGLMIYGNAEIMGVPWELVIKAFRKHLGTSSFDTVDGYAKAFRQFMDDSQQLFPREARLDAFDNAVELQTVICCRDFNDRSESDVDFDEEAHLEQIANTVDDLEFTNGLDEDSLQELLASRTSAVLAKLRSSETEVVQSLLGKRTDARLIEIIALTIKLKAKQLPEGATGLVFAGYGDASIYPEAFVSKDAGFIADQLVMANVEVNKISQRNNSYISGFAQASMADTFIIGFDAQAYQTIKESQLNGVPSLLAPFLAELGGAVEQTEIGAVVRNSEGEIVIDEGRFNELSINALGPISEKLLENSRQKHGEPLERVISMLPVEEMAELAATLVDLQSLKEKVTRPSETVGGPVDVAIITKNEGLIWKKRKHFFDIDLNQRYLRRLNSQD
ncbi:hypothetical protein [Sulfitobacter sp. 1A16808]|uniref:hypothetical protein n=1 Tax=Sulfitobacter sp. 1A16808 TaxID=3368572 RepID=UPI003744E90C